MEHIIIGDTLEYKDCLVYVIKGDRDRAEEVLKRMLNNPTAQDSKILATHTNLRVEAVKPENAWWNDPFLMSD